MKKKYLSFTLLVFLIIALCPTPSNASDTPPTIEWQQEYMGDIESISNVIQTSDGGYTILGTWSTYGTTYEYTPTLLKADSEGNIIRVQNFSSYIGRGLLSTNDGGFATMNGFGIIKINAYGTILWNKTYLEPANHSIASSMIQTSDGGYALVGSTSFNGTNDTPNLYYRLVRVDSHGSLLWSRQYGNGPDTVNTNETQNPSALEGLNRYVFGHNQALSLTETTDGGFVIAGKIYLAENYSPYGNNPDIFLVKTDSQGTMEWNRTLSGYNASPIIQTSDGGVAIAVLERIVKIDSNGTIQWEKNVSFPNLEPNHLSLSYLIETADGALAFIGVGTTSQSWWGDVYMIKTEPFLPLPTPSPTPLTTSPPILNLEAIELLLIIIGVIAVAGLLVYFKRRKR